MSGKMQAVICHGPMNYKLEEIDIPTPGPGEALVKVEAVGICASDLKCYHGAAKFWGDANRPAWAETEVVPGHEFVGEIVQLDDAAAKRWNVKVGDRVVAGLKADPLARAVGQGDIEGFGDHRHHHFFLPLACAARRQRWRRALKPPCISAHRLRARARWRASRGQMARSG